MNIYTTIVLLVLLVIVGTYFVFVEMDDKTITSSERQQQRDESTGTGRPLFDSDELPPSSVVKIKIEKEDEVVELAKEGDDWWQTGPVRFALNGWDAGKIPEDAAGLEYIESFKPGTGDRPTTEQLKLAPVAVATVTIEIKSKPQGAAQRQIIRLGKKLAGHGYVMINEDPKVYVVGDGLHKRLMDKSVADWRKTSLDSPGEGQVDHVMLVNGDASILMAKADSGWSLEAPLSGRVDRKKVDEFASAVDSVYVSKFIKDRPQDLSAYGLDKPSRIISLRKPASTPTKGAASQPADGADPAAAASQPAGGGSDQASGSTLYTLRIGSPVDLKKEKYFATWQQGDHGADVVFSITKSTVEKFDKVADDFRDPRLTPLESADVRQIEIQTGDGKVHLVRTEDGWKFDASAAPGFPADDERARQLIDQITNGEAASFAPDHEPATPPLATVTLGAVARTEPDVLKVFAAEDESQHLVKRNNETTGYLIARDDIAGVFEPALALRRRLVLDPTAAKVHRVVLARPDGLSLTFERDLPQVEPEAASSDDDPKEANEAASSDDDLEEANEAPASQPASKPADAPPAGGQPGPWKLAGHERFETSALDALLDKLMPLRAADWISDASSGPSQSKAHQVQIFIRDAEPLKLSIDVDSKAAAADGVDLPFHVSDDVAEAVNAEFRNRTVLSLSTTDIAKVAVTRDGATLVVTRNDDGDYAAEGGDDLDESATGDLFDTLAGLRVERYGTEGQATDAVALTIEVALKDDITHRLVVPALDDEQRIVLVDGHAYLMGEKEFEKLTASLLEASEEEG